MLRLRVGKGSALRRKLETSRSPVPFLYLILSEPDRMTSD